MSTEQHIETVVHKAATTVGSVWPLHSFVTANPLAGFEDLPFEAAVTQAEDLIGGRGYPSPETFQRALAEDRIDPTLLETELAEHGYDADPATLLERMADEEGEDEDRPSPAVDRVDGIMTKWLAAFCDEDGATWPMPDRESGFYAAVSALAPHDDQIPDGALADLPDSPTAALATLLEPYPQSQWVPICEEQLAALPGWTGFIKRRVEETDAWQDAHPITLEGYLAVRLALLAAHDVDLAPSTGPEDTETDASNDIAEAFLSAWEATYRGDVVDHVAEESAAMAAAEAPDGTAPDRPDAQLVFCIDTRSEVIRRHVEAAGDYETHGYAGFFGVPMAYEGYDDERAVEACPPIVDAQHHVHELPTDDGTQATHDSREGLRDIAGEAIETLKTNPATAFGFVEHAGSGYGLALAARTLVPSRVYDILTSADDAVPDSHEFCEPVVHHQHTYAGDLPVGLTHEEKVDYAATAFETMGWETFGRLVAFVGHASETANNPYDASLDCGACAGNPGGPSARVLAAICSDDAVVEALRERGIDVPEDTVFLAGEHNTTTDAIELYGAVPDSHEAALEQLKADLATAREGAAAERAQTMDSAATGVDDVERRAGDWAETRPEWGLAGNAGFVVGPRELTEDLDLDGRAFLHSYDWLTDPDGEVLETILTGPMVVTQWINAQYYFSTVDTAVYGSGSKVTQNPVGNVGVYQGNGGDLMTGLPSQSVKAAADEPYHQPLRLSTVVHAPVETVTEVLADHDELTQLLDNDWLSLTVVDPTQDHAAFHYEEALEWTPLDERTAADPAPAPAVADD